MTVMTVTTGGVMWYVLTDLGNTTAESINFVEPAPGKSGGGYRNAGLQGINIEDLRLTIVTSAGRQEVPLEILIGQVGPTFDPREIICVVGEGCIVPAAGSVRAELQVRGQAAPVHLTLEFPGPAPSVGGDADGTAAPALPGLPELQ